MEFLLFIQAMLILAFFILNHEDRKENMSTHSAAKTMEFSS